MASSLVITVNSTRSQVDNGNRHIKSSTLPREECRALMHYFQRLASGEENGNIVVQSAALSPLRSAATATITNASVANNDTVTVAGVVLTAKTSGATGPQFNIGANATITAANLVAAVNATAVANQLVTASSLAGVVTLQSKTAGLVGNFLTLTSSNGAGVAVTAFTGGAGGAETAVVAYSRGL